MSESPAALTPPGGRLSARPAPGAVRRPGGVRRLLVLPPAAALLVLPALVYRHLLEPGQAPGDLDAFAYVYPYGHYLAQAWSAGRLLPLWNPNVFLGVPFLANTQATVLYPPSLLFLLVPGPSALGWSMALHVGIAGLGMFAYAHRAARLRLPGSLAAGAAYALSGHLTVHLAAIDLAGAIALAPWLMLAFDRAAVHPGRRTAVGVAAASALIVLAGHEQQAYLGFLAAGLAGLLGLRRSLVALDWRRLGTVFATWAGGGLLAVGLAAAQLVPTAELLQRSYRHGGLNLAAADVEPLPLHGLIGSVLPHYSGPLSPEFTGVSSAAAVLVLAAFAVLTRWRRGPVAVWAVTWVLATWGATGASGRLFPVLFHVVPGLNLFRAPGRLLLFSVIAISLLAGYGVRTAQQLVAVRRRPGWASRGQLPLALAGAAVSLAILSILPGRLPQAADVHLLRLLPVGLNDRDLLLMAAFTAAVLGVCALALRLGGRVPAAALAVTLAGIVIAESWLATDAYHTRRSIPAALYTEQGPADALVSPGTDQRFLSLVTVANLIDFQHLEVARRPNVRMGDGRLTPDGYDGGLLPTGDYVRFRAPLLGPGSPNGPDVPIIGETSRVWDPSWLDAAGVAAVLTDQGADPNPPGCRCLQQVSAVDGVALWRPAGPLPTRAWVEGPAGRQPAHVAVDAGEHVVVALPSGAAGRLVLADAYYPGWTAAVDGRPAPIAPYAGMLRAVDLPPGAHQVTFDFQPASVRVGVALSGLSVIAVLLLALWPRRRRRRAGDE